MICDFASEILPWIGKDASDPAGPLVQAAQAHAERLVKDYVGFEVEQKTFTEILPAQGGPGEPNDLAVYNRRLFYPPGGALQLKNVPVRSVGSVYEGTVPGGGGWPASALLDPGEYWLDADEDGLCLSGLLYKQGWSYFSFRPVGWSMVPRSIRVTYTGGWTAAELLDQGSVYKLAVKHATVKFFREAEAYFDSAGGFAGTGPIGSESIMGWSQSFPAAQSLGMATDLPASVKALLENQVNYGKKIGRLR